MASVKQGAFVSSVRGAFGNSTFRISRGRQLVQINPSHVSTDSAKQVAARSRLMRGVSLWRSFSDAERKVWDNAAHQYNRHYRSPLSRKYGARELYLRIFMVQDIAAFPPTFFCPTEYKPCLLANLRLIYTLGDWWLETTFDPSIPGQVLRYWFSRSFSKTSLRRPHWLTAWPMVLFASSPQTTKVSSRIAIDLPGLVEGEVVGVRGVITCLHYFPSEPFQSTTKAPPP